MTIGCADHVPPVRAPVSRRLRGAVAPPEGPRCVLPAVQAQRLCPLTDSRAARHSIRPFMEKNLAHKLGVAACAPQHGVTQTRFVLQNLTASCTQ